MSTIEEKLLNVQVVAATLDQMPVIANLLELYAYDFTEFWSFDIGDDGFYGYKDLPLYFSAPHRYPHIIFVNGKIAGLVMVQRGAPISEDPLRYDMAEFFIMRKFKRKGVGTFSALETFSRYVGPWQVRCLMENKTAHAFWKKTIERLQGFSPQQEEKVVNGELWTIFHFESKSL